MKYPGLGKLPARLTSILGVIVVIVLGAGCTSNHPDAYSRSSRVAGTPIAEIAKEAAEFGAIVIPEGATVLNARTDRADRGPDTLYQLALRTDPQDLTELLTASNLTNPLTKLHRPTGGTIAGPPLETSPSLRETGDRIQRPDGKYIYRTITVDERDPTTRYVHVQLHTT